MKPTIEGETNVLSCRFGRGAADGLGKEIGRFIVTTMEIPWNLSKDRIGGTAEKVVHCQTMEIDWVDRELASLPSFDTVLAVGGGQAIDLGKYFAWKTGKRLVSVPTILSVDAFVTPASAIRKNHQVEYVGVASPDPLVIDYDLLRLAPNELNIAGVGDLLSNHTACKDWEIAHAVGKSEFPFKPESIDIGRDILKKIMDHTDDIRQCTDEGLQAIVDGYMRLNTVCLPNGHYRIEEGSEHYLFYELEERLGRPFIHGWIVGLGVYCMSRLQDNHGDEVTDFMKRVGLKYDPQVMEIKRDDLRAALLNLKAFVESRPKLWYTVINEKPIEPTWVDTILAGLVF
ncbi:iron-containing alcohol dehydrogenase [bacterium]|nr:iron-containing alcohol dehydrogenase [bacterium]